MTEIRDDEIERYARQIILPEIGGTGQVLLKQARVAVIGAGGLGCPLLLYLAGAGVGHLTIIDHDRVGLSNLHRQILFQTRDIGKPKADVAADRLMALNPTISVTSHVARLGSDNLDDLLAGHDVVCDGSDNFETRFLVAATCRRLAVPLVSAAVFRYEAQIALFPHTDGTHAPCYRCLYPDIPDPGAGGLCSDAGILGPVAGVAGCLQATLVLLELMHVPGSRSQFLYVWNLKEMIFRKLRVTKDLECPFCGH